VLAAALRIPVIAAVTCALLASAAASAATAEPSRARARVSLAVPKAVAPGGTLVATGAVSGAQRTTVLLQRRAGGGWRTVAHKGATGRFLLHWSPPRGRTGTVSLRAAARRGGRIVARSAVRRVRVRRGAPSSASATTATTVLPSATVRSLPAAGQAGSLVLSGHPAVQVGTVVAIGAGPGTPDGFLGKVQGVTRQGDATTVATTPASLMDAVPEGAIDLDAAQRLDQPAQTRSTTGHAAASHTNGTLAQDLTKSITCEGGASFAAGGQVSVDATPKLSLSWGLFSGVSASFTETVSANASLTGTVSAAGSCTFDRTGLLKSPATLGTFEAVVLGVPVVITLKAQVYLDGTAKAAGSVTAGIQGGLSASGGIAYKNGRASVIAPSANLTLGAQGPTLAASASVGAHVTPELQVLLYGVGGPVFDARTGLDFAADIAKSPWWTLTAPLTVTASLQAPVLGLSTPSLKLYDHTWTIAQAAGGFTPPPVVVLPPPPPPPAPKVPASGPTLVDEADTVGSYLNGDTDFTEWGDATGQDVDTVDTLPADLTPNRCVVLLMNDTIPDADVATLGAYLKAGGTVVALGEHTGGRFDEADEALNGVATALGADLALNADSWDDGSHDTFNVLDTPYTDGVSDIGDNWVSSLAVGPAAQTLVATDEDPDVAMIAAQRVGDGLVVMSGDSNAFTDNNDGFYGYDGNGRLVSNLCG
jgi:hypothetical protein